MCCGAAAFSINKTNFIFQIFYLKMLIHFARFLKKSKKIDVLLFLQISRHFKKQR